MTLTDETIIVNDGGFASEAVYHTFMPAEAAIAKGYEVDDIDATYVEDRWTCMLWPYSADGRMMGEHVYTAKGELRKCPPDEVITMEEAKEKLTPMIDELWSQLEEEALETAG
ncbi:hypothetical protein [Salipiger abyssi]|uniref:Uncharacterized protein n=1 Tax=Salipiger abyssi TaxID=1250539 RepID=A0A1P8UN59_9RHOB|nr:hypothetical protein [Salipiger abyssi]APZ50805.1 hypothetical protein Ga0080574_TMP471 [Salipiger abyssi]